MMQGLHHHHQQQQQQQLASLLSVALRKDSSGASPSSTPSSGGGADADESNRVAALHSLHRFILYPPNSLLVAHSATFLSQGLFQLLSDNSYTVRQSAATTYGALCSVLCSVMLGSNGRHNHVLLTSLVDRFINWALPLLRINHANNGSIELALEGIHEFLSVGDAVAMERYSFPALKSCQELLEDERTSITLLHQLLGVLTVISLKFLRSFQPHFVDIVDLLLGWAMVPDLAESDTRAIIGSFMQFQKHWVFNLQFPLGLLLKFLGDMDVLLQDGNPGTPQQFRRLVALLSCFSTVLQSTASGMLELNLLGQIIEPLNKMIPKLLGCLSMVGKKFGWSKWNEDLWRCLTLLAEILGDRFSDFYSLVVNILFQILDVNNARVIGSGNITSSQIHGVLKTNLQLLSLQKFGLLSSSVRRILQFDDPISQLRLHPNHLVTASSAATYIFLLQHGKNEVVECAIDCLLEELILLHDMLEKLTTHGNGKKSVVIGYSRLELLALFKFDLKVLSSAVILGQSGSFIDHPDVVRWSLKRSEKVVSFIVSKLNPVSTPISNCMQWQVCIFETLKRLTSAEFLRKCSIQEHFDEIDSLPKDNDECVKDNCVNHRLFGVTLEHLQKYSPLIVKGLELCCPLAVKLKCLDWIHQFVEDFMIVYENSSGKINPCEDLGFGKIVYTLIFSVLNAALDGEPKVRSQAAAVSELLLRSRLVHRAHLLRIGEVILEKLGEPDAKIQSTFIGLLADILPVAIYLHGQSNEVPLSTIGKSGCISKMHWKQIFALNQLPQHIHAQQLVSVLGFISQRWKVPLPSWIERVIYSCQSVKEPTHVKAEETEFSGVNSLWLDIESKKDLLENISSVNHLAGVWWAINEAARYCTSTRLRTNLGGPTQTFAALERMLLDVSHVLQIDAEQSDGSLSIIGSSGAHLLPMRLLLDFVEALKKNVYNAYDGCTVLPCASRQSSLFFRANKKVCEEWFSRICEPMMNAALALQYHDTTIHYSSLRLLELRCSLASALNDNSLHSINNRLLADFIRVVRHMALALCKKREPDMLIGLQKWVYNTFSSLFAEEKQIPGSNEIAGALLWINGLVYEAKGQYEKSAAFFAHLLQKEESLSSIGADGVQFAISRIIQGYTATSDWKSLEAWLSELQSLRIKHAGKSYSGALNTAGSEMNAIHAMARFDEHNLPAAWASLDLTMKSSCELTLDPKLALQRSEQMLLQAMLHQCEGELEKVPHETQRAKLMLGEVLTVLPLDGTLEATPYATQLHCIFTLEKVCRLNKTESIKQLDSSTNLISQALHFSVNKINQDCDSWLKLFRVYRTVSPTSPTTLRLCKNMMTLARKQGNLELANRLKSYLKDHIHSCSEVTSRSFLTSSLQYEEILMMHAENKIVDAVMEMWSFVRPCLISSEGPECAGLGNYLKAKACLKLSTWLRQGCSSLNLENLVPMIFKDCNRVGGKDVCTEEEILASGSSVNHMLEEIVGAALKMSTRMCPAMGKSWISYASWCFGQAKDVLSSSHNRVLSSLFPIVGPETLPQIFTLTKDEISQVESIISTLLHEVCNANDSSVSEWNVWKETSKGFDDVNPVIILVQQVVAALETAAGAPGADDFDGQSLSEYVVCQLKILLFSKLNVEETMISSSLDALVNVWWSLRRRRVSMFGQAAQGFIQFLCHSSSKLSDNPLTALNFGSLGQNSVSLTLRATLFILHILLNYGVELKDMLEPALSSVPLSPWQELTPQLFARLSSHSEPVIRKQLEGLLMMLAKLAPRSIVYPTLVDINTSNEEPPEELQHILDCLMSLYPRLVQDVRLMMHELGNVTVLWEELWLSTLQDLHGDVMRRLNLLKEEAARMADNNTLSHNEKCKISASRYSAMMAPIFVSLERRLALTSRKPETPHEEWFQEEYQEQLKSAISAFKTPPESGASLGDVWRSFDTIAASLAAYQRKSSVSLQEVAPQLACLSSSDVPMPGLEKQVLLFEPDRGLAITTQGLTTIASFSEEVSILPSKTKPKKLVILGSDGEKYTYLLKGREDLRLDARIMQLLEAVNNILHSSSETIGRSLGIRYYSVTPISSCAGLIQWVDNVISIYSVFKSWQQRIHQTQLSTAVGGNRESNAAVPRPSDMFYGKIIPALKEKGIRRAISRRDWPHEVKRRVLLELMQETPKQLLHQELWCVSEDFKAFSSKLKRYSGSLAAMSVVGHILGLGDRHLDNILMDFVSGDIVHIDYNVCFDKGKRLKVPEIVPFRLTQTLEAALGLTGVEGCFRANCESVLGVLRKNKDILLMLLEVFVWDPLVEWTRGDSPDDAALGGEERKGMELAVSLSLFASRVQEIRIPLQEHHDLLLEAIPSVESGLKRFLDALNQYEVVYALFYRVDQERSALHTHEATAKSLVAETTSSLENVHALYEMQVQEFGQAKALVIEKTQEATTWIEQHGRIIEALRSGTLPEFETHIKPNEVQNALTLISAVSAAGVPLTIVPEPTQAQCYDIDREISQNMTELDHSVSSAVTSLQAFSLALQRVLPLNYLTTSPMHGWAQVLQICTNTISSDALSRARRQATELIARGNRDFFDSVSLSFDDLCRKVEKYALEIRKLEEECSELASSIGCETDSESKARLLSAFLKYMQSAGLATSSYENEVTPVGAMNAKDGDLELKKKVLCILYGAVCSLYDEAKCKILDTLNNMSGAESAKFGPRSDFEGIFCELEEHTERCILVEEFVNELRQLVDGKMMSADKVQNLQVPASRCWATVFKEALRSCKDLLTEITDTVMPDLMRYILSSRSEVMDAFGSLSQIRGSVETALEQLVQVELERESLADLEKSYFVEVGHITEQQLTLEEAAMKGRDQLSWEEAEELASQEESCRAQLNQLHRTWNQKEMQASSLNKKKAALKNSLDSSERHFLSLLSTQDENMLHIHRGKAFLSMLGKLFAVLESLDKKLSTCCGQVHFSPSDISLLVNCLSSGGQISEHVWRFKGLLNGHSFFVWKVGIIDSVLELIIHDVPSSMDQNMGFEQLASAVKKKLVTHLHGIMASYLKGQIAPALLNSLNRASECYEQEFDGIKEIAFESSRKDSAAVKKVQIMLEEYCNAHETVRAVKSASSLNRKKIVDLKEVIRRTSLEIVQTEWMRDVTSASLHRSKVISQNFFEKDDRLHPLLLNLSRSKLLEALQSAVSLISRSRESLQSCEMSSATAEGQLERAMNWACGGPTSGMSGNTSSKAAGIPPEFHNHLTRRRKLLQEAQEKAKDVMQVCLTVLEFEASRDGYLGSYEKITQNKTDGDCRTWQQNYLNALMRLDVSFHSLSRAEQEWKVAQSNVEAASNSLSSARNELQIASVKANSASGDLQNMLLQMKDCACETSIALSAFSRVVKLRTALTSECGSLLEEVLSITGLHDVLNLGKEAASVHHSLMEELSKASAILLPLESVLSKDVSTMTDAMEREREIRSEISPIHGQAICQSYSVRIKEASQRYKPLVPLLMSSVKELYSLLTKLAQTASLHAGNLHKALEGLGEREEAKSQEINFSTTGHTDDVDDVIFPISDGDQYEKPLGGNQLSTQERGWISPPESAYSSSSDSESLTEDVNSSSSFNGLESMDQLSLHSNNEEAEENVVQFSNIHEGTPNLQGHESSAVDDNHSEFSDNGLTNGSVTPIDLLNEENSDGTLQGRNEVLLDRTGVGNENQNSQLRAKDARVNRGKNAFAVSVLRRIEMKIDGRDIDESRQISTSEQVEYLLKQATSIDNLCNMYEGWTAWI